MALLWIDGFDHYTDSQLVSAMYEEGATSNIFTTVYRTGRGAFYRGDSYYLVKYLPSNHGTLIAGCAFYWDNATYGQTIAILSFADGATVQIELGADAGGYIRLRRGTTTIATSTTRIPLRQWRYLEIKATFHPTAGYVEVRMDTNTVLTFTGNTSETGNAWANRFRIHGPQGAVDDVYCCDASGALNNDFLGDIKVHTVKPNANGTYQSFAVTGATQHYDAVDDVTPDGDTTYLSTNTVGATETEQFEDIALTGTVRGVLQLAFVRKDDAGARQACLICRSGAADYEGPTENLSNTYTYLKQLRETDPATGALWTVSGLNAAEFGVRMKA